MTTEERMMEVRVMRGTVRNPGGPERSAEVDGLGSFSLHADDPLLAGAQWSPRGWTVITVDRAMILDRIAASEAEIVARLGLDRKLADRQLAAMERQAEEE